MIEIVTKILVTKNWSLNQSQQMNHKSGHQIHHKSDHRKLVTKSMIILSFYSKKIMYINIKVLIIIIIIFNNDMLKI